MKHGALMYVECVGDDLTPERSSMPFLKIAKCKPDETVIFSFIAFTSKAHRDRVNKQVTADPAMSPDMMKDKPMPFDMKRMAYGGFQAIVDL